MHGRRFLLVLGMLFVFHVPSVHGAISFTWLDEPINMTKWPGPYSADLDLDGNGIVDFILQTENLVFEIAPLTGNAILAWPYPPPDAGSLVIQVAPGLSIGETPLPGSTWWEDESLFSAWNNIGSIGFWVPPNEAGYFGIRFTIDTGIHYGWVFLDNSWGSAGGGDIYGWAYETTPGMPIMAGAIPEPSALSLIGIGALAILYKKKSIANNRPHPTPHKCGEGGP